MPPLHHLSHSMTAVKLMFQAASITIAALLLLGGPKTGSVRRQVFGTHIVSEPSQLHPDYIPCPKIGFAAQEHPLSLIITIRAQPGRTVRLRWLRALHLVTAEVAGKAGLSALAKLFPDDDGLYIASDTAHAAAGGHLTWDAERLDRPYR